MRRHVRLSACALLAAMAQAGVVQAESPEVKLIQPGDATMSCEALAGEINSLSATQAKAARRAESGKKFFGFATTALQVAGPMLSGGGKAGGDGGMSAMMAQQAMGQMQAQAMQQQMGMGAMGMLGGMSGARAEVPEAGASVESQRLARLNDLHANKGC